MEEDSFDFLNISVFENKNLLIQNKKKNIFQENIDILINKNIHACMINYNII